VYELNNSYAATHEAACSVDYYSDYPGLKLICSTNHLLHSLSGSFGLFLTELHSNQTHYRLYLVFSRPY